jgi:hypothetical protein
MMEYWEKHYSSTAPLQYSRPMPLVGRLDLILSRHIIRRVKSGRNHLTSGIDR